MQFLSYLINGISLGSVYALIALGYTMVYGIAKMLNFAHGDVIMIGSYVVFFAFGSAGMNPVLAIVLSMVVCTVLGVTIERVAYRPLREAPSLAVLITAIGVSYLLQQVAQLAWTSNPKSFTSVVSGLKPISLFGGQLTISAETVVTIIACIVIMVVLIWFVNNTPAGHAMLAVSEDRGGKAFICMTSTFTDKQGVRHSRILPHFGGDIVTSPRSQAYYLATEYGVVNLAGRSTWERAEALVSIAHPDFREQLIAAAESQKIWRRSARR